MIKAVEAPESRDLHYGASGGGMVVMLTLLATNGESEQQIWLFSLTVSPPFFHGFIRQDIKVKRKGATHLFSAEVEYGTTGVGGGGEPLGGAGNDGGPPPNPTGPGSDTAPLTSGFSFSIRAPRLHLKYSLETVNRVGRLGALIRNHQGAIGVGEGDKIEGCDVPPEPGTTLKVQCARASVTAAYFRTLRSMVGKVCAAPFYRQQRGEVIYLAAEGTYTQGENWSLSHEFGCEENRVNVGVDNNAIVFDKEGFQYAWAEFYERVGVGGLTEKFLAVMHIERVCEYGDFSLIEIGT